MLQGTDTLTRRTLDERGLKVLLGWLRRGVRLERAARAAGYRPEDALTWYWGGQHPECPHPLWAELAFEAAQILAKREAKNYSRTLKAAKAGEEWAIKRLDNREQDKWLDTYPGQDVAREVLAAVEPLQVVPVGQQRAQLGAPAESTGVELINADTPLDV